MADAVRNQVGKINPALALADITLMDQIVDGSVATPRFAFILVGLFGGLAILLAAIGTYGVISYSVTQRTPEFGLRMALGAQRWDVLRLVLLQATKLVFAGTTIGVALALLLARALKSLIYNVSPNDPLTFTAIGIAGSCDCHFRLLHSGPTSNKVRSDECITRGITSEEMH